MNIVEKNYKKVLIAPLDWGLGHATRIIPIINALTAQHFEVIIASSGAQQILLQKEFPHLLHLKLQGYNIHYSKAKRWFTVKILFQIPKILSIIKKENIWLQKIINEYKIDLIISDNRFGLYSKIVPCVLITHQLEIQSSILKKYIQKINYYYINKYNECWIPDFEGAINMAGKLSHPKIKPQAKIKYIGALSRFERTKNAQKKYNWMIILSGPEPQRTILEKKLINIIPDLQGLVLLVRGKPTSKEKIYINTNCVVVSHLHTSEMQTAFDESDFIISRSGYTTAMEVLSLKKKSILIPTPGQTEQIYLARHLMLKRWCYSFLQEQDFLQNILKAKEFNYSFPLFETNKLKELIKNLSQTYFK